MRAQLNLYIIMLWILLSRDKNTNFRLDRTLFSNIAYDLISGVQRAFSSIASQAQYNRTLCDSSLFTNQSSPVVR